MKELAFAAEQKYDDEDSEDEKKDKDGKPQKKIDGNTKRKYAFEQIVEILLDLNGRIN